LAELSSLTLEKCDFGNEIAHMKNMPKLREISIKNCYFFTELPSFSGCSSLAKIEVYAGNIPPRIAPLSELKTLTDFSLTRSSLARKENGIPNINFLSGCSALQRLNLGYQIAEAVDV